MKLKKIIGCLCIFMLIFSIHATTFAQDRASNEVIKADHKEYAQVLRVSGNNSDNRGVQGKITLPSKKALKDWDYINFYGGIGQWECGISTRPTTHKGVWKLFSNHPIEGAKSYEVQFLDGESVTLKLYIDDQTNKVIFIVNDKVIFTSKGTYDGGTSRMVIASCQSSDHNLSWRIKHGEVKVENMHFKDSAKEWKSLSYNNASYSNESWGSNNPTYYDIEWSGKNYFIAKGKICEFEKEDIDTGKKQTAKEYIPIKRYNATTAVVDGKIYVIGGQDENGKVLNVIEVYDPSTNTWKKL